MELLLTDISYQLIILSVLISAGLAYLVYFTGDQRLYNIKLRRILASLRFLSFLFIALLLLKPAIKQTAKTIEKPLLITLVDNSASMKAWSDSLRIDSSIQNILNKQFSDLDEKLQLETLLFDETIRDDDSVNFEGTLSNLSKALADSYRKYRNHNIGAFVLISDGNYNVGANPTFSPVLDKYPVYTIKTGDAEQKTDVWIDDLIHNKYAFAGNEFALEVYVNAVGLEGAATQVQVYKGQRLLAEKNIRFKSNRSAQKLDFFLTEENGGLHSYSVKIKRSEAEQIVANNTRNFYIDIINTKKKIFIVHNNPHPDIAALKQALENKKNLQIEVVQVNDFDFYQDSLDLVIFHQVPSLQAMAHAEIDRLIQRGVPLWFISGLQTNVEQLSDILPLSFNDSESRKSAMKRPSVNKLFSDFTISERFADLCASYPPLQSRQYLPLGGDAKVLLNDENNFELPVLSIYKDYKAKVALLSGEGMWRWRMHTYRVYEDFTLFDDFVNKLCQYLMLTDVKSQFELHSASSFDQNEEVIFTAKLFNKSYETITTPEINMRIKNEKGEEFSFDFVKDLGKYRLNIGNLDQGTYSYVANTNIDSTTFTRSGSFVVVYQNREFSDSGADHEILEMLAQRSGADAYDLSEIDKLKEDLKNNEQVAAIAHYNSIYKFLSDYYWLLVFIIVLIALEWFLRKYRGGY